MANTYTQIYLQFVFSVKYRDAVINNEWKDELYKYITGIVKNNNHKMICINGIPDHIHILVGLNPVQSISNLLQDIKGNSSKWINEKRLVKGKFEWQEGYGAFSYSQSQIKDIVAYIENQEEHHKKKSFNEEYLDFLKKFEVSYDEKFTFKELI
ncbi:MAG: IS200/IS605 family transposase [Bacteroidota bacterium]|nr:IS200/IS605 family transposase [Bacteroidota bacterium]MDP3145763.1 IS200/IS605 family transposase [Bacteroidota bacterium]